MAANAIININSDLTVISDMNSVFKSSADNSSSFANVFENVNKSYTEKNNETSANDVISPTTSEKPKVDAKNNETKKAEDAPSTPNDIDTEKTITDNKNTDSTSIKDTTENSNESEDKTKTTNEESINPEKIIVSTEVEKALQSLIGVDILQVEPTQLISKNLGDNSADKTTNIQIQAQQVVPNSKNDLQKVDLKPSKITADTDTDTQAIQGSLNDNSAGKTTNILLLEPTQLIQKSLSDNSADKTTNIQIQAQQVVPNSKIDLQKVDLKPSKITADTDTQAIQVSLSDNSAGKTTNILPLEPTQLIQKNLGDNSADKTTNIQIQAQQIVPNSKIDSQKVDIQSAQITADTAKVTDNQTPMIKVDVQAIIANNTLNVGSNPQSSQNSKDVLDKATITQDMLNKTNAKVISVETSSSNQSSSQNSNSKQNNLLNKQNPEEQVIKLSLESNAASNNINVNVAPNISNISDTTLQTNFAKTVDNIQTPKELSHNDILSQINSKLDNLQTENLTKVNIVLKPENLGKINLELINSKEGLIAKMTTDNQQVKEILNKNLDGLKETLSNQGVNVNNVTVKIDETQKQSNDMFSFDNRQSNQGNQDLSGNSNKSNKDGISFEQEINQLKETKIEGAEELISVSSYLGQVDYKI